MLIKINNGKMEGEGSKISSSPVTCPLNVLFPNGTFSSSAPTTPVACKTGRNTNYQASGQSFYFQTQTTKPFYFQSRALQSFHYQPPTPLLRFFVPPCNNKPKQQQQQQQQQQQKGRSSKRHLNFKPFVSSTVMGTTVTAGTGTAKTKVYQPYPITGTPATAAVSVCYSRSAPTGSTSNNFRPLKDDASPVTSAFQKRPVSLDLTPKKKGEKRSARRARQQQQPQETNNINFAGAKFSESPQAKVVPMPPSVWCQQGGTSSSPSPSGCSGDELSASSLPEMMETDENGITLVETPKRNGCIPTVRMRMTPLQLIAAVTSR